MAYKMKQFLTLCFRAIDLQDENRVAVYPQEWLAKRGTPPTIRPHTWRSILDKHCSFERVRR
jgi:hypothetical protein